MFQPAQPSPAQETVLCNRCWEQDSSLYDLYSGDTLKVDTRYYPHGLHTDYYKQVVCFKMANLILLTAASFCFLKKFNTISPMLPFHLFISS